MAAVPADAHWQYTKWETTPDQVVAASAGKMKRCDAACEGHSTSLDAALTYGVYSSGEFVFTAFGMFDRKSNKLARVSLQLRDASQGFKLAAALRGKYGEPISPKRDALSESYEWNDAKEVIYLFLIGNGPSSASLTYRPRNTSSTKGL